MAEQEIKYLKYILFLLVIIIIMGIINLSLQFTYKPEKTFVGQAPYCSGTDEANCLSPPCTWCSDGRGGGQCVPGDRSPPCPYGYP